MRQQRALTASDVRQAIRAQSNWPETKHQPDYEGMGYPFVFDAPEDLNDYEWKQGTRRLVA